MRNRYPDIKVRLIEGLSGDLKALVNARQLDVAIIFSDDVDPQWYHTAFSQRTDVFNLAKRSTESVPS